jgi:hypothetical protein
LFRVPLALPFEESFFGELQAMASVILFRELPESYKEKKI